VQFVGSELGQHGPNVYFKEFSVSVNGEKRNYKLGDFYFVQKDSGYPVCIAEFQLIWMNLQDRKKLAAVKLYFRPEDTTPGRLAEHGEDELMEADRHVPVYCEQLPSWECKFAIPYGRDAYQGISAAKCLISKSICREADSNCTCGTKSEQRHGNTRTHVKVLSFPAYCRYRATMKLIQSGCSLPLKTLVARGAIDLDCCNTKILFNRFKFQHDNIESFSLAENIRIPVFKGRPRKRRQSKTKPGNDGKKMKLEMDYSYLEANLSIEDVNKEKNHKVEMKNEGASIASEKQTYRIIAPPANCNPERNVIHVKIENKKSTPVSNDFEKEDMKIVIKTNAVAEESYIAEKENRIYWDGENIEGGSMDNPHISGDEVMVGGGYGMEVKGLKSPDEDSDEEDPPSELVKNGKTGTVLDESFFRRMRNGMKGSEMVDKEKMRKILVDACKDVEAFKHDLFIFMKQRGTPIVYVPKVGYTRVDLPKLFSLVVENGGYRQVTLDHKWKKVYDEMSLATTITSAATCMRRHYEKLLLPFEKYLRIKHHEDALPCKTYSISAQTNQPLVLKIKTIKNETIDDCVAKVKSPLLLTEQEQLQSPCYSSTGNFSNSYSYKPINILGCQGIVKGNKSKVSDPFTPSHHLDLGQDFVWDGSETSHSPVIVHTSVSKSSMQQKESNCQIDGAGRVPVIFPYSTENTSNNNCPSDIWQSFPSPTDKRFVKRFPETVSTQSYWQRPAQAPTAIFPRNESLTEFHSIDIAPTSSYCSVSINASSTPLPNTCWSSGSVSTNQPATNDYTKTKTWRKEFPQSEMNRTTKMQAKSISQQFGNSQIMIRKRGRPPKHSADFEVIRFTSNQSNAVLQVVGCTSFPFSGSCLAGAGRYHLDMSSRSNQVTTPTPSLGRSRMCTAEVDSRKGNVQAYKYVIEPDSSHTVKHHQVVTPAMGDPADVSTKRVKPDFPSSGTSFRNQSSILTFSSASDVHQDTNLDSKFLTHYPRVKTVMSFANNGCLPSALIRDKVEKLPLAKVSHVGSISNHTTNSDERKLYTLTDTSQICRTDSLLRSVKETKSVNNENILKGEQELVDERCLEPRPVIPGPPPLVPIEKRNENVYKNEEVDKTASEQCPKDHFERVNWPHRTTNLRKESDIEQLSFVSDLEAMKESFNVESIIRPMTKTIDQSLAKFKKVAVNEFDDSSTSKYFNGELDNQIEKQHERDVQTNNCSLLRGLHPVNLEMAIKKERKIEVERALKANETECKRNFEGCQRKKQQQADFSGASEDSNQRLLRIAPSDDIEGYAKEVSQQSSGPAYNDTRWMKAKYSSIGSVLHGKYDRHGFNSFEPFASGLGKYGHNFVHPANHELVCLSDKCKCSDQPSHHRCSYFGESSSNLLTYASQKSSSESAQNKVTLLRDQFADSHGSVNCHRPTYENEDTDHRREAYHHRNSHHLRKYLHNQNAHHVPFYGNKHNANIDFQEVSPNALYPDAHHVDCQVVGNKGNVPLYQNGSPQSDFGHHSGNSTYASRMVNTVFEHNRGFDTQPPSSIRSPWYATHHFAVKECHGSMTNDVYWRPKVYH